MTPTLYHKFYPQDRKSQSSLFWFGLNVNIFFGNVLAITQQSLWGRALDYAALDGGRRVSYAAVVGQGLKAEGLAAFFTPTKWFSRVLMNAPIQGTVPWFYNEVLPLGEGAWLAGAANLLSLARPKASGPQACESPFPRATTPTVDAEARGVDGPRGLVSRRVSEGSR